MNRFESDYNPSITYDASCRIKEMGLNREPERFLKIKIATDPLHTQPGFSVMKKLNKEACEQFNSLLRSVQQVHHA